MRALPHLGFDGRCAEAFRFYETVFGGRLEVIAGGASPMTGTGPRTGPERVLHATLTSGELCLTGSDASPDWHATPQGLSVSVQVSDVGEAERIFTALARGGTVELPLMRTCWAERFGMATDRFDIPWVVTCTPGP